MKNFFFNKKELAKFNLFKILVLKDKGTMFSELQESNTLSKSTLSRYIKELEQDIQVVFSKGVMLSQDEKTGFYTIIYPSKYNQGYLIDKMHLFYINESGTFTILDSLLKNKYPTIDAMSMDLNMSVSSIYKHLKQLKKVVAKFKASIVFNPSTGNLEGNEIGIRLFAFYAYWSVFKSTTFNPFHANNPAEWLTITKLEEYFDHDGPLSESQKTKLRFMQLITIKRIVQHSCYLEMPANFYQDIAFFDTNPEEFISKLEEKLPSKIYYQERLFFLFATRGMIYNLDSFAVKEEIVKKYRSSQLRIARLTSQLLDDIQQEFGITYSQKGYVMFYFYLLIFLIYLKYIRIDFSNCCERDIEFQAFIDYNNENELLIGKIRQLINNQTFYQTLSQEDQENFLPMFSLLIYGGIRLNKETKSIAVCVIFNNNLILADNVRKTIFDVYNQDRIFFTNDVSIADLIISDSYEGNLSNAQHFYFDDELDPNQWKQMISMINQVFYEKLF